MDKFKLITLERTPCFGRCPVYKVKIENTGQVTYLGKIFCKLTGEHSFVITNEQIRELNKAIAEYGYFNIDNLEHVSLSCSSSCITSVTMMNGKKKSINNNPSEETFPKILNEFESRIDEIIGIDEYVKIDWDNWS